MAHWPVDGLGWVRYEMSVCWVGLVFKKWTYNFDHKPSTIGVFIFTHLISSHMTWQIDVTINITYIPSDHLAAACMSDLSIIILSPVLNWTSLNWTVPTHSSTQQPRWTRSHVVNWNVNEIIWDEIRFVIWTLLNLSVNFYCIYTECIFVCQMLSIVVVSVTCPVSQHTVDPPFLPFLYLSCFSLLITFPFPDLVSS